MALGGVGLDRGDHQIGVDPVGDEGLRAVDDVVVAVPDGGGGHRRQVRPDAGLGHADRGDQLAGDDSGQPALLLLLGAVAEEVGQADVVVQGDAQPGARVRDAEELLAEHGVEPEVGHSPAVVLLRHLHAEESLPACGGEELPGRDPGGTPLVDVGGDLLVDEGAHRGPEGLVVVVVERAAHVASSYRRPRQPRRPVAAVTILPAPATSRAAPTTRCEHPCRIRPDHHRRTNFRGHPISPRKKAAVSHCARLIAMATPAVERPAVVGTTVEAPRTNGRVTATAGTARSRPLPRSCAPAGLGPPHDRADHRHVHVGAGRQHRQRRDPDDAARLRVDDRGDPVGGHGLLAGAGRGRPGQRLVRRPVRLHPRLQHLADRLRRGIGAVRAGLEPELA